MANAQFPDLIPAIPELFLAGIAMALLMFGVFQKGGRDEQNVNVFRVISWMAVIGLVLALLLTTALSGGRLVAFGNIFVSDGYAVFCKVLVLTGSASTLIISKGYLERQGLARFEYPILVIFATLGMMMMISANDLISLYLGLEMQSLSLYVIAAFQRDDGRSTEAGLKYFVLGALASGMLLYGSSLVYGFAGTTNFDTLAKIFGEFFTQAFGFLFHHAETEFSKPAGDRNL